MKKTAPTIQWFTCEDRRRVMRASIGTDQKLRLGEELRKQVPTDIRLGFDAQNRAMIIADGHGAGITWPKTGILNAKALCKQLRNLGLKLPLVFEFEKDFATGFYVGSIVPQKQADTEDVYDVEQMLVIYQPLIDSVVNQLAKSTPKAERKAIAVAAFCEAVRDYNPSLGEWGDYLEAYLRRSLILENRKYSANYRDLHIETPFRAEGRNGFCLRDKLEDQSSGGIYQMEAKIMAEQFRDSLSEKERHLLKLMRMSLKLPQIALEMQLTQDEVIRLGREIGQKREAFYS